MPVIFVGNKKDLVQKPDYQNPGYIDHARDSAVVFRQVQEISNSHNFLRPVECSAKTGENVDRIFNTIAHELVRRKNIKPSLGSTKIRRSDNSFCGGGGGGMCRSS